MRWSLCMVLLVGACVPVVSPPVRMTIGPAVSAGIEGVDPDLHRRPEPMAPANLVGGEVRIVVEPLAAIGTDFRDRVFDVGAGYVYLGSGTPSQRFAYHGGTLELGAHVYDLERRSHAHRFSLHLAGEVLARRFDGTRGPTYGGRLSLDYETGRFVERYAASGSRKNFVGHVRGEATLGASLGLAMRVLDGAPAFTATLALSLRIPAIAGAVGIFPK